MVNNAFNDDLLPLSLLLISLFKLMKSLTKVFYVPEANLKHLEGGPENGDFLVLEMATREIHVNKITNVPVLCIYSACTS